MATLQLEKPKEIIFLLREIKMDIEELKEMIYPEKRIRPEFIREVKRVEKEMARGKKKRFSSKREVEEWLRKM